MDKMRKFLVNQGSFRLLLFSLAIFFVFGFYHLSNFISADEHFWLPNSGVERIEKYWEAIAKGDWKRTRINDKPGITLAWTAGIGQLVVKDIDAQVIDDEGPYKIFDPEKTKEINFYFRLPILLLSGLFSLFFFWIIKKITDNEWIALFSATLILLSPILLGISQIVNPDSLFWIFGAASFFSFFAFLKFTKSKFAVLSGLFLGFSLASKYVSVIFFPFFFVMLVSFLLWDKENLSQMALASKVKRYVFWYLFVLATGMLIFALMMPASFVEPKFFYEGTIGFPGMENIFWATMVLCLILLLDAQFLGSRMLKFIADKLDPWGVLVRRAVYLLLGVTFVFVVLNWLMRNSLIDLSGIPFDSKRKDDFSELALYKRFIMEAVSFAFSMTPIALLLLVFAWVKEIFKESKHYLLVFLNSLFFLVFYVAVIQQGLLVTPRYSIILFPLGLVVAAIGLWEFFNLKKENGGQKIVTVMSYVLVGVFVALFLSYSQELFFADKQTAFYKYVFKNYAIYPVIVALIIFASGYLAKKFPWKFLENAKPRAAYFAMLLLSLVSLILITPFYFSYTNNLLPKKYIISGAWGYGGYEAAQVLNAEPDAKNKTLWADAYGVCEFFVGKCIRKSKVNTEKYPIDYYFRSLQATIPMNFPHPMEKEPLWRLEIDNRSKSFLKINRAVPESNQSDENQTIEEQNIEE